MGKKRRLLENGATTAYPPPHPSLVKTPPQPPLFSSSYPPLPPSLYPQIMTAHISSTIHRFDYPPPVLRSPALLYAALLEKPGTTPSFHGPAEGSPVAALPCALDPRAESQAASNFFWTTAIYFLWRTAIYFLWRIAIYFLWTTANARVRMHASLAHAGLQRTYPTPSQRPTLSALSSRGGSCAVPHHTTHDCR